MIWHVFTKSGPWRQDESEFRALTKTAARRQCAELWNLSPKQVDAHPLGKCTEKCAHALWSEACDECGGTGKVPATCSTCYVVLTFRNHAGEGACKACAAIDEAAESKVPSCSKDGAKIYCTSFCNHGHRLDNGKPVQHECFVLPPAALEAERAGQAGRAIEIINAHRPLGRMKRGTK